jgi:glycosyltransferase involved in cell wall biosynthesis
MNVLILTNNPNLGSTTRILQSWLRLGRRDGLSGRVVVQCPGDFSGWLGGEAFDHFIDPMPLPDRRWPVPALWHAWRVARWARRRRVEVIHCNEHDTYPFAVLLRRLLRRPLVCHVRFRVARPYCQWAFGRGRAPDALLWTSRQQRDDCAAAVAGLVPPERQHLVSLGVDLRTFGALAAGRDVTRAAWGVAPGEVVVGTASALRPIKRIEDFVELARRVARRHAPVRFALAGRVMPGDEDYGAALEQRIRTAGLGDRFLTLGHLEPVEPFMHAVDVFVSTSEYETFGNSVCEAMACRRPVAAYRGGSVHEVVGDAGRVVPTGDLAGLKAAVEELVTQPGVRAELGDRGRRRVAECFDPAQSFQKLMGIYKSLARGKAARPGSQENRRAL